MLDDDSRDLAILGKIIGNSPGVVCRGIDLLKVLSNIDLGEFGISPTGSAVFYPIIPIQEIHQPGIESRALQIG
uniref:Uncharacterized protein n=1 Tax=Candidatus Kentrum sp. UNK TaxID=2126344 RepID=A0A451ASV3_9GAMM|nr:MAG: hypothetical protein BECKUNK1418G_GA0071005_101720 [Candidatus Kentron sp. UNK]VFK69131.1 MAG: hypothetical protein BECKUNK1418H_GA0071006_101049 [Candidatus Kentron sp. UNK]